MIIGDAASICPKNTHQPQVSATSDATRRRSMTAVCEFADGQEIESNSNEEENLATYPVDCSVLKKKQTHIGEKLVECAVCNKKFANSSEVRCHLRTHTGEKLYECPVCNKKFGYGGFEYISERTLGRNLTSARFARRSTEEKNISKCTFEPIQEKSPTSAWFAR
ncbi:oocyte zinc finger protein XlCOF28-like isoform X3 [Thrips palmi]|uniref:Oocyte zinc finger protein XlCOF28-like isoform X3 n=1 Tax=Thrips palmi TaxID=161013 RepID=A0A6P8ZSE7_THRPL|nr:oocyte zinc finger protein XlCOF28-like isoform X3 [Thrips palmi]